MRVTRAPDADIDLQRAAHYFHARGIHILRILHQQRDIPELLREE